MGTEVLMPRDVLGERFPLFRRRRNFPVNAKPANIRNTYPKGDNRRRSNATTDGCETRRKYDVSPAFGQVTLLKRGQSLDSLISKNRGNPGTKIQPADDLAILGTARIGPESPEMMPKWIHLPPPPLANVYAGSAFSLSPSPRSLPLPSFFNKKQQNNNILNDSATRDLRRLLRLD